MPVPIDDDYDPDLRIPRSQWLAGYFSWEDEKNISDAERHTAADGFDAGANYMRKQLEKTGLRKHHYVECHVIVADDPEGRCLPHAKEGGWWGSRLGEDGSNEEKPGDLILTTRRKTPEDAINAIRVLAADLERRDFRVTRGKTEVVTFDTKLGDSLS